MDVSDIKLLYKVYSILDSSNVQRSGMSHYEFRVFVITELKQRGTHITCVNETIPLFAADQQVILFFPNHTEISGKHTIQELLEILLPFSESYLIAYAIFNGSGACIVRFQLVWDLYTGNRGE